MAVYHWVDDLRSPAGWLPVHWDQLRAQRLVSSMGNLYIFYRIIAKNFQLKSFQELVIHGSALIMAQ